MARKNSEGIEIEYRTFKEVCEKERKENIEAMIEEIRRKTGYPPTTKMAWIELALRNLLNEL